MQETQVAVVENDIAKTTMEVFNTNSRTEQLRKVVDELNAEIAKKNDIVTKCEAEISRCNAVIERKQGILDQYNKKKDALISKAGVRYYYYYYNVYCCARIVTSFFFKCTFCISRVSSWDHSRSNATRCRSPSEVNRRSS